jgi:predicted nucleotidyltransferase
LPMLCCDLQYNVPEYHGGSLFSMVDVDTRNLTRAEIADRLRELAAGEPRILALYLFGSRARGEEMEGSDVDVGVLFREPVSLGDLVMLEAEIEPRLGLPVDLVDAGRANAFLALDIIRGERVFCSEAYLADEFELYVLRRAGDLAPYERERRRLLLKL